MADKQVTITLTYKEAVTLMVAAGSIAEDVDEYGFTDAEKAAYTSGMASLRKQLKMERNG